MEKTDWNLIAAKSVYKVRGWCQPCLDTASTIDPHLLTGKARIEEIARILAVGILRAYKRQECLQSEEELGTQQLSPN